MKRILSGALVVALLAAAPALAQYALPLGGAAFEGKTNQARGQVRFVVASSGTSISKFVFVWRARRCEHARNGVRGKATVRRARIADNHFRARGTRRQRIPASGNFGGGTQVVRYRITGGFVTPARAQGTIRVVVTVLNRAGVVVDTCRMRSRARWKASRLGVTVPE